MMLVNTSTAASKSGLLLFLLWSSCSSFSPFLKCSRNRLRPLQVISQPPDEKLNLFQIQDSTSALDKEERNVFYDVDYEDDEDWDYAEQDWDSTVSTNDYARDDDDILTEREDRLYIDADGNRRKIEKCLLVGVEDLSARYRARKAITAPEEWDIYFTLEESMTEMRELIRTAGLECAGEMTQRLQEVNPKTYIGTGKVKEALALMETSDCSTVVFDAELTPGQQKALENAFNRNLLQNDFLVQEREIKVVDRTALILDIFAQHAKTREGKLQVDLALHEYRKPRLTRMWTHLERQSGAGGVGLRGPGESQLEIDKRLVRDRIIVLKQKIESVQKQRTIHRQGRHRTGLPVLSLVGYTNAGKSTLLNHLTRAGVMAHDMLFATLDPTTRRVKLPGYKTHPEVLLTDTVGFIQKLPTQLVAAFRATLEEVQEADVLVHVVDVANPCWVKQELAVRQVLAEIGASDKPIVTVFNKIDLLGTEDADFLRYEAACKDMQVAVSSLTGEGLQDFVAVVEDALSSLLVPIEVEIPYSKGEDMNAIHEVGAIDTIEYRTSGTYVLGRVPKSLANRLAPYSIVNQSKPALSDGVDWTALGRGRHKKTDGEHQEPSLQ
jgi:GTP-binding protein HflX